MTNPYRHILKAIIALLVAIGIVMVVRDVYCKVFTVTQRVGERLLPGDRVLVIRRGNDVIKRGEMVVFWLPEANRRTTVVTPSKQPPVIGVVKALPGDTILLNASKYLIPQVCCRNCGCPDCKLYLVQTGTGKLLVHKHQLLGRAYRIFHLPW